MFAYLALTESFGFKRLLRLDHLLEFGEDFFLLLRKRMVILGLIFFPQYFFSH